MTLCQQIVKIYTVMAESVPTWSSEGKLNLAMFSYSVGLMTPRLSAWMIRTKAGILLLFPVQLLVMIFTTIPCLFMELALGQYSGKGVIKVWDLCPILRGIGLCAFITFFFYQIYYNFLCTCTLCFAMLSLGKEPQWKSCNKSWNKASCFNYTKRFECPENDPKEQCDSRKWESSVEQFYFYRILHLDDASGAPSHELIVYSMVTGVLLFFANYSGPRSTEKFSLVLAIIPTLQLFILIFIPLTDYSGFLGFKYLFVKLEYERLSDPKIWIAIVETSLRTSGLGFGSYITLGIHCSFRSPLHFKVIMINVINVLFAFVYGIVLQNFLISLCLQNKMLFDDFLKLEQDLVMPEAVFFLRHSSRLWTTIWLSNIYMLGLRTSIVMVCISVEVLHNSVPKLRKYHNCCVFLFCALICSGEIFLFTNLGYLVSVLFDKTLNEFFLLFLNTFQMMGVVYCYGVNNFKNDIYFMLGIKPSGYWLVTFMLNPISIGCVLIYNIYLFYQKLDKGNQTWLLLLEHILMWSPLFIMCFYAVCFLFKADTSKFLKILKLSHQWGPRYSTLKESRKMFTDLSMRKEFLYLQERFSRREHLANE